MSALNIILVLTTTFLIVFLESTAVGFRNLIGAQPDLLPSLVVYASLSSGLALGTLVAVCGGLLFDSLSWNPLGISILPLFFVALIIQQYRGLILRDQFYAQFVIGLTASAATPVAVLLLVLNTSRVPLLGWSSLWQWVVMSLVGGIFTPAWFLFFGWMIGKLSYESLPDPTLRSNREIKRGRS